MIKVPRSTSVGDLILSLEKEIAERENAIRILQSFLVPEPAVTPGVPGARRQNCSSPARQYLHTGHNGRPRVVLPNDWDVETHEKRRVEWKMSKRKYAIKIGMAVSTYLNLTKRSKERVDK